MNKGAVVSEKQVVLFKLGNEIYGVDIAAVHEIIRMQPVTRVPRAPAYVEGVINLRGKVIPIIDMGKKFGLEGGERGKNGRIVVVDIKGTILGIIVDAVTEVKRIPQESIEATSDIIADEESDYLTGIAKVEDKMVILLDLDKLLSKESNITSLPSLQNRLAGAEKSTIEG